VFSTKKVKGHHFLSVLPATSVALRPVLILPLAAAVVSEWSASAAQKRPICTNSQLKLSETKDVVGISQYSAEGFRVTNIGKSACSLDGFPQVEFDVESPKNTYHAAAGVRTPAGRSEYFKTE